MRRTIFPGLLILAILSSAAHAVFEPAPAVERDGRFGSGSDDFSGDIAFDALGNSYHMVSTDGTFPGETSAGGRDVVVRKNDPAGNELWTTQIGTSGTDNYGRTMAVTPSGISAIVGNTPAAFPGFTFLGGFYDAFVALFDADGNQIAVDQFGTASWDEAYGVYTDGTKFWVTGFTDGTLPGETSAGGRDGFVRVYGLDGSLLDSTQFGTSGSDNPTDVAADGAGNVYVTGFTGGAFSPSIGLNDGFVVKLDPALDFVVGTNHGTTANDNYKAIDVGAGGHVVVVGATFGAIPGQTASGWDIVIEGIDPVTTSSSWIRQFGLTSSFDSGEDVAVGADGTSHTAGNTYGIEGLGTVANPHGFVVALDAAGSDLWGDQFIAIGATLEIYGVGLDPAGRAWLAGYTKGTFGGPAAGGYDAIYRGYQSFAGNVTDITACGFVADAPGDYRLAGDVVGGGVCIDVTSPGVVLDLNGFRITAQDDGTDLPGVGVRVGAGLDTQILNQGTSSAEIVVESAGGIGVDLSGSSGATLDGGAQGVDLFLDALFTGMAAVDATATTDATVQAVTVTDHNGADGANTGIRATGSTRLTFRDAVFLKAVFPGVGFAVDGTGMDSPVFENVTTDGGTVRVQGANLQASNLVFDLTGRSTSGPRSEFDMDGLMTGFRQTGGGAFFAGRAGIPLQLDAPEVRGFERSVEFGDDVRFQTGLMTRLDPSAVVLLSGQNGTTEFESLLIGKRVSDRVGLLFDAAPGASADFRSDLTIDTLDDATGTTTVGSQLYVQDRITVGKLTANVGFRYDHVADSPADLARTATEVHFRAFSLTFGDKQTYRDGILEPGCVAQPDGYTIICPSHPDDAEHVFAHETATGCATYATPDLVIYQDTDLDVAAGTTCIDLQARLTWECGGRSLRLPAGAPGGETVGFRVDAAGSTVENCRVELQGADTIGTDVTADDATLRTVRYEYDDFGTRGIRARNIENFTVIDDSHIGTGAPGVRTVFDFDAVGNLRVLRSYAGDPLYAYDFQWDIENSDGTITNADWTGGISASGAGVTATLVVEDSLWDSRRVGRTIDFGDDVVIRRGRLYVGDESPIGNRAVSRGPRFEDATFYTYDERGVPLIEDNPGAPSVFAESLRIRTERNGLVYGRTEFPPTVPDTSESGVTTRYAYDDLDTARLGDDLPVEPTVSLTFEQMETPSDPLGVAVHLVVAAQDAIASGGCVVSSVAPDPVELTCDRDLGTGLVQAETLHYVYCGDGIANAQVPEDACDPPGSGKCQAGCTLPPPTDLIDHRIEISDTNPDELILTWNDSGEGPYEIYRSTDPANVATVPENKIGLTSGTTWTDAPPAGQSYYYRVIPAP